MLDLDWEFKLIQSGQHNAFALPSGKIAFYNDILIICKNEVGVASVGCYRIAHAIAGKSAKEVTQNILINEALSFASLSYSNNKYKSLILGALGVGAAYGLQVLFSRSNES